MRLPKITFVGKPDLPKELIYVSRRIVTEIVQADTGRNPRLQNGGSVDVATPFGGIGIGLPEATVPDYSNLVELAARSTLAVERQTARVDGRGPRFADIDRAYLRTKIHLQMQDLSLGNWERRHDHPLAAFTGLEYFPGVGRVFLGLIGSAHNHLPEGSIARGGRAGRTPSDPRGLLRLIQEQAELTGSALDPLHPVVQREITTTGRGSDEARFNAAVTLFHASALHAPSFLAEVLVQVHHYGENVNLHLGHGSHDVWPPFSRVVIGAPVWIGLCDEADACIDSESGRRRYQADIGNFDYEGTEHLREAYRRRFAVGHETGQLRAQEGRRNPGEARPLDLTTAPGSYCDENWKLFDSWLQRCIDRQTYRSREGRLESWPPASITMSRSLGRWFVEQAATLGPEPIPFFAPHREGTFRHRWHLAHSGQYGWLLHDPPEKRSTFRHQSAFAIVLLSGEIYPCTDDGTYLDGLRSEQHRAKVYDTDALANTRVARAVLHQVAEWRRPLYMYGRSQIVIEPDGVINLVDGP